MFDTVDKKLDVVAPPPALSAAHAPSAMETGSQAPTPASWATALQGPAPATPGAVDMNPLFGHLGDEEAGGSVSKPATQGATTTAPAPASATAPAETKVAPDKEAKDLKTHLANNPLATRSLDSLTGDKSYQGLSDDQKRDLLTQFQAAPNAATTNYLRGLAEYQKEKADDKSGDPQKEKDRLAKLENAKTPDSGSFSVNGNDYNIVNGKLMDKSGKEAGTIDNLGNYQMTGAKGSSNYYNDLSARVQLQEGSGKDQKTLLDLHATDPHNRISGTDMNPTFVGKVDDTFRAMRHEGIDMGVAPQGSFRSFESQDGLYAQGRTKPGNKVTNARGGESFHNYGLAALSVGISSFI